MWQQWCKLPSSLHFLDKWIWMWYGTFLIPLALIALLKLASMHMFGVPFSFMGNSWVSFLKPTLWMYLSMYSQVTFSLMACPLLSPPFFVGVILPGLSWKDSMYFFGEKPLQFFFFYKVVYLITLACWGFFLLFLCCVEESSATL